LVCPRRTYCDIIVPFELTQFSYFSETIKLQADLNVCVVGFRCVSRAA